MELVAWGLMIAVLLATVRAERERASLRAIQGTLVLVGAIPSFAAPSSVRSAALGCIIVCLLVALLKAPRGAAGYAVNWPLVLLMLCVGANGLRGLPLQSGVYLLGVGCGLALLAVVFPLAARAFGTVRPLSPLAFMLPIHLALGLAEQGAPTLAFWPKGTSMDFIANRPQELLPALAGRSMSLAGHPILLGTLAVAGILVAVELFRRRPKARYVLLVGAGTGALLLSGTRSAVFAGAICLVLSFLLARRGAVRWLLSIALVGAVFITLQAGLLAALFNEAARSDVSYAHRTDVLTSTADIYRHATSLQLLLGVGDGNGPKLFQTVIDVSDDLQVFDNQLVRFFAVSGIISLVLLVGALVIGLHRADRLTAALMTCSVVMFFSFETMTWLASAALLVISTSGPREDSSRGSVSSLLGPRPLGRAPSRQAPERHLVTSG